MLKATHSCYLRHRHDQHLQKSYMGGYEEDSDSYTVWVRAATCNN